MNILHKFSPAERRFETGAEARARIEAAHAEAQRIACPHGPQFYKCDCGEEWSEQESYPIAKSCHCCGERVEARDNPYRKAWFDGFKRAQELAE